MTKHRGVPKPATPKATAIPRPKLEEFRVKYSFEFLDVVSNGKFTLDKCQSGYLQHFFERLKSIGLHTEKQLRTDRSLQRGLHSHPLDFSTTSEPGGFGVMKDRWDGNAWQIGVTVNEHGRLHGFLEDGVFYLVWIDAEHLLYPKKG